MTDRDTPQRKAHAIWLQFLGKTIDGPTTGKALKDAT
jgi:hypothetical protein